MQGKQEGEGLWLIYFTIKWLVVHVTRLYAVTEVGVSHDDNVIAAPKGEQLWELLTALSDDIIC